MRRIVVIAAGPPGILAATRIKRRLPEHEINVVIPAAITDAPPECAGPAARRRVPAPNLEILASREVGVLEAQDIMPDLAAGEITVISARGRLPVRYTDLIIEAPATVRLPRALHRAENVFPWPQPDFSRQTDACDAALAAAAAAARPVLVVGSGPDALDAVCLALEAGAGACWLRVRASETPALETQMEALALRFLGPDVTCVDCADVTAGGLGLELDESGTRLERVVLPDGAKIDLSCALWTTPLMGRHPVLREEGIVLDSRGRISLTGEGPAGPPVILMGSGAAVPGAVLPCSGLALPSWPGGRETAECSAWAAIDAVSGKQLPERGVLAVREAALRPHGAPAARNLSLRRAGLSLAEAQERGREAEYAIISSRHDAVASLTGPVLEQGAEVTLALTADRSSRTLMGAQTLALGPAADAADGLFGMAVAALAEGTRLDCLARRAASGVAPRMLALAASILCNKMDTIIKGITPDEFLASRKAGAEFFTLDLRALPDWRAGHVPGAYNIPLPQLKKRLQDEVPRFTPLVLVSADGRDAYAAACRLAGLGATDLYVLDGGMHLWPYAMDKG